MVDGALIPVTAWSQLWSQPHKRAIPSLTLRRIHYARSNFIKSSMELFTSALFLALSGTSLAVAAVVADEQQQHEANFLGSAQEDPPEMSLGHFVAFHSQLQEVSGRFQAQRDAAVVGAAGDMLAQGATTRTTTTTTGTTTRGDPTTAGTSTTTTNGLRRLASEDEEGATTCEEKLEAASSEIEKLLSSAADAASSSTGDLFVQMAKSCKLRRKESKSKGTAKYVWSSFDIDDDTYRFSDRPLRSAGILPTSGFFRDFDDTFDQSSGGKPNGAITFRHSDTKAFEGPLVSIFVDAVFDDEESGRKGYQLSQSEEQASIVSLDDFFGEDDTVVFDTCSVFLDSVVLRAGNCCRACCNRGQGARCAKDSKKMDDGKWGPVWYGDGDSSNYDGPYYDGGPAYVCASSDFIQQHSSPQYQCGWGGACIIGDLYPY